MHQRTRKRKELCPPVLYNFPICSFRISSPARAARGSAARGSRAMRASRAIRPMGPSGPWAVGPSGPWGGGALCAPCAHRARSRPWAFRAVKSAEILVPFRACQNVPERPASQSRPRASQSAPERPRTSPRTTQNAPERLNVEPSPYQGLAEPHLDGPNPIWLGRTLFEPLKSEPLTSKNPAKVLWGASDEKFNILT